MFCPNCGKEVPSDSNFCPNCGKNLKKVKVYIDHEKSKTAKEEPCKSSADEKTIVFKPVNLDGIDNTKEISNIIREVDNKISENINKYATSSQKKLDAKILEENQKSATAKSENNDKAEKDSAKENQKFSLKKWWHNFINEGDDEFSIFASMDENKDSNDDKIELSTSSTSSDTLTGISADTLSIPKETMEAKLAEIDMEDNKTLKEKMSNIEEKVEEKKEDILEKYNKEHKDRSKIISEENIQPKEQKIKIKKTKLKEPAERLSVKSFTDQVNEELKRIEEEKKNKEAVNSDKEININHKNSENDFHESKNDKIHEKVSEENKSENSEIDNKSDKKDSVKKSKALTDVKSEDNQKSEKKEKELPGNEKKSFTDQVNEELKKMEKEKNSSLNSKNKKSSDKTSEKANKEKKELKKEKKEKKKEKEKISKKNIIDKLNNFFNILSDKLFIFDSFTKSKGKKSFYTLLGAGIIITLLPLIIAERGISIAIIILLLFKLLFAFLEFYFSLKIATEQTSIDTTKEEVKYFAFENWFICQIFLFIAYILSPWNGFFNFTLLPALTPLPIAMIILFIMSISISFGQYWHKLKYENKINFAGWYSIPFILIHFTSKLFFLFFNLIV